MDRRDEPRPCAERGADAAQSLCRGSPEEDGDRSLIRWMLSLSPAERLEVLQRQVDAVEALRALN